MQKQFKDFSNSNLEISGPVENEKQKLESIAKTLGVDTRNKSEDELRKMISSKIGEPSKVSNTENNSKV